MHRTNFFNKKKSSVDITRKYTFIKVNEDRNLLKTHTHTLGELMPQIGCTPKIHNNRLCYWPLSILPTFIFMHLCECHSMRSVRYIAIDIFHIVSAHACSGHVTPYISMIGETLHIWGKQILSHRYFLYNQW